MGTRRSRRWRWLGSGALLAALLLGACTGDDDGESGDPDAEAAEDAEREAEAFSAEYRQAAERYADRLEEVQEEGAPQVAADPIGAHEVYAALAAVTEAAREDFAALEATPALSDELDGLLENFEAQLRTLAEVVEASRERDDRALQRGLEDYADQLSVWRDRHTEISTALGHEPGSFDEI